MDAWPWMPGQRQTGTPPEIPHPATYSGGGTGAEISSISFSCEVGDHVDKGSELGFFSYGGSTLCLVFQKDAIMAYRWGWPPLEGEDPPKIEVGNQIATANPYRD